MTAIILNQKELRNSKNPIIQQLVKQDFKCLPQREQSSLNTQALDMLYLDIISAGKRGYLLEGERLPEQFWKMHKEITKEQINTTGEDESLTTHDFWADIKEDALKRVLKAQIFHKLSSPLGELLVENYSHAPSLVVFDALKSCIAGDNEKNTHTSTEYWPNVELSSKTIFFAKKMTDQGSLRLGYETYFSKIILNNGVALPGYFSSFCEYDPQQSAFVLTAIQCSNPTLKQMLLQNNYGQYQDLYEFLSSSGAIKAAEKKSNRKVAIISSSPPRTKEEPDISTPKPMLFKHKVVNDNHLNQLEKILKGHLQMAQEVKVTNKISPPLITTAINPIEETAFCRTLLFEIFENINQKYKLTLDKRSVVTNFFMDTQVTERKMKLLEQVLDILSQWYQDMNSNQYISIRQLKDLIINAAKLNVSIDSQKRKLPFLTRSNTHTSIDSHGLEILTKEAKDEDLPANLKDYGKLGQFLAELWNKINSAEDKLNKHAQEERHYKP